MITSTILAVVAISILAEVLYSAYLRGCDYQTCIEEGRIEAQ